MRKLPDWANEKQIEGMKAFLEIAEEYGQFNFEFKDRTFDEDTGFSVDVKWNPYGRGERVVEFSVFWNYEQLFNHRSESIDTWQFVFADNGFEMSGQLFYMELFQQVDNQLVITNQASAKEK